MAGASEGAAWALFESDKGAGVSPDPPAASTPRMGGLVSTPLDSAYTAPRLLMIIPLLIGASVAGGTYWYAKSQKKASSGKSAAAAAVTGAAGWGAAALVAATWPILLIGARNCLHDLC